MGDQRYLLVQLYEVFLEATVRPVVDYAVQRASRAASRASDAAQTVQDTTSLVMSRVRQAVLTGIVAGALLVVLLWLAVVFYAVFYYFYIPAVFHSRPVYFQFDPKYEAAPFAMVDLTGGVHRRVLHTNQEYDVIVKLRVPESDTNRDVGMFMATARLLNHRNETIHVSSRPATLTYQSSLVKTMRDVTFGVPLVLGWMQEMQTLSIPLLEQVYDGQPFANAVTKVYISLSKTKLEVYDAELRIEARFSGLRYYMYNWFLTTAAVGISLIVLAESLVVLVLYLYLKYFRRSGSSTSSASAITVSTSSPSGSPFTPTVTSTHSSPVKATTTTTATAVTSTTRRRSPVARNLESLVRDVEEGREPASPLSGDFVDPETLLENEGLRRRRAGASGSGSGSGTGGAADPVGTSPPATLRQAVLGSGGSTGAASDPPAPSSPSKGKPSPKGSARIDDFSDSGSEDASRTSTPAPSVTATASASASAPAPASAARHLSADFAEDEADDDEDEENDSWEDQELFEAESGGLDDDALLGRRTAATAAKGDAVVPTF